MPTKVRFDEAALAGLVGPHGVLVAHMAELAERVAQAARQRAPFDAANDEHTHVRDGIEVQVDPTSGAVRIASTAADSKGRPVGLFVEVGTKHMSAEPYLRPAFDDVMHRLD